jgi:hypothetical protein
MKVPTSAHKIIHTMIYMFRPTVWPYLLCEFLFYYSFLFITWIAYNLERNTEDVDEVFITFKYL